MAQSKLCQYFSMIRSREQILLEIRSDPALNARFEALSEEAQKEFLDICTGEKGVKILYDSFFRSVMNPELYPDRGRRTLGHDGLQLFFSSVAGSG